MRHQRLLVTFMMVGFGGALFAYADSKKTDVRRSPRLQQLLANRQAALKEELQARQTRDFFAYAGTRIEAQPNAEAISGRIQTQIAALLSKLDPRPAARLEHFGYLANQNGVRCNGWYGQIIDLAQTPYGFAVTISVTPNLAISTGGDVRVTDSFIERYVISGGEVRFVEGQGKPLSSQLLIIN